MNNIKTKTYVIASGAKLSASEIPHLGEAVVSGQSRVKFLTGAASLYVVIFTTLLLGIITLGFIRIMLSEAVQTSETDLSQSAFDSALAGVEDAKVALLKYHDCISNTSGTNCKNIIEAMRTEDATSNCDIVRDILGRQAGLEHETIIQSDTSGTGAEMEQAYTCVLIAENNDNYLGQLNSNYHSKVIPLRTTNINELNYVRIDWYSGANASVPGRAANLVKPNSTLTTGNKPSSYTDDANIGLLPALNSSNPSAPPVIGVQLFQTDGTFSLTEMDNNNSNRTNRGALYLTPYPAASSTSTIDIVENSSSTGFSASADKAINLPIPIKCQPNNNPTNTLFFCSAIIGIPKPYRGTNRNEGSAFLRVFLPYGTPATDFSVALCRVANKCGEGTADTIPFVGVQARIDATGRANDLFRRIESRIELVDVYFPFPEYSVAITPDLNTRDPIVKNFWVTKNNWGSGSPTTGVNSGQL